MLSKLFRRPTAKTPAVRTRRPLLESLERRDTPTAVVGVTSANLLVMFDSATPNVIQATRQITGLPAGQSILGIDYRPATGELYGHTRTGLFTINTATGAATPVQALAYSAAATETGFDFNPAADALRVVNNVEQNLRFPTGGTAAPVTDTNLAYANGDSGFGLNPNVVASAYDNNDTDAATATTLYGIDSVRDVLVIQNPANDGTLTTVGGFGFDVRGTVSFDIVTSGTTNTAYMSVSADGRSSRLYTVDLTTGTATLVNTIGSNLFVRAVSAAPGGRDFYATTATNRLLSFSAYLPQVTTSRTISGLASGEVISGIDVRPSTGVLHASTNLGNVYTLDPATGAATQINTFSTPRLNYHGFDFNPQADALRIVDFTEANRRLPTGGTGTAVTDTALAYESGDANFGANPAVAGSAYSNNVAGATSTTLYAIDAQTDSLVTQNPANGGLLQTVGALGFNTSTVVGFDITADGFAYATLTAPNATRSSLYRIDLTTGAATLVGQVGGNELVFGLAAVLPTSNG